MKYGTFKYGECKYGVYCVVSSSKSEISISTVGAIFPLDFQIIFIATATDDTDGDISSSIIWSSHRDGIIGTGRKIKVSDLSLGKHKIKAKVYNSGNFSSVDTIIVYINEREDLFFDEQIDMWIHVKEDVHTFPLWYRRQLNDLSSSEQILELRSRGCLALPGIRLIGRKGNK